MKTIKTNRRSGFTIVELVIVIAVIAILATVLIPSVAGMIEKANRTAALEEARSYYVNYVAEFDYTSESPVDDMIVRVGEEEFVAIVNGEVQNEVYSDADSAQAAIKNIDSTIVDNVEVRNDDKYADTTNTTEQ